MAGDWIPMRLDLAEDPAVLEMAEILGESEEYIVGSLHKIWSWASRQCHDGTVTGVTVSSLSRAVKLPTVVVAMVNVGWLIEGKNDAGRPFIAFPKWENWLSKSAKSRLNNSINQRNSRANKSTAVNPKQNPGGEGVTDPSLSGSDKTVTTGEKSTEEDKDKIPPNPLEGESGGSSKEDKPDKPKRKPAETIGVFDIPPRLDTPEVRQALVDFEAMRLRTGKRIKDRGNICRGWDRRFEDAQHLLDCIDCAISNEYQGISPTYVKTAQSKAPKKPDPYANLKQY